MKEYINKLITSAIENLKKDFKDYIFIAIGLIFYAAGVTMFLLPYKITTGGVTGIASLIFYASGVEVQVSYLLINIALLVLAIKAIGLKFCIKTIYGVSLVSIYLWVFQRIWEDPITGELPTLVGDQSFMAVVLGAICEGIALGICFSHNGSTGGTDILMAVVNKYKDVSLGHAMMLFDCVIISSSFFIFHEWEKIVFGFTAMIISGVTLDYVMSSTRQSVQFLIFSRNYKKIATLLNEQGFGVTVLDGTGWYTQTERKVIVLIARKRKSTAIFSYVKSVDPYAFISMSHCRGVYGEGFDTIKVKTKQSKHILVFATNNVNKLQEVKDILGEKFEIRSLEDIGCNVDIPETSDTFKGNALQKAEYIKRYYGFDCFADDTGLEVNALDGAPGIHSARYAGDHDFEANTDKLLKNLENASDRSAQFTTVIALLYKGQKYFFDGNIKGQITTERHGTAGFGYDPVFIPDGYDKTFAELGDEIKNKISHRAIATKKLFDFLNVWGA